MLSIAGLSFSLFFSFCRASGSLRRSLKNSSAFSGVNPTISILEETSGCRLSDEIGLEVMMTELS